MYIIISDRIADDAVERQDASLRVAAAIVERDLPGTNITRGSDGNVERIVMETIPSVFEDHAMLDSIGEVTGEIATIFTWDEATRDFWRTTTNVVKSDGKRAVGTQLGQNGAVYPVVTAGNTYRGEALVLGAPYFTVYQPIFAPSGEVIGVLTNPNRWEKVTNPVADPKVNMPRMIKVSTRSLLFRKLKSPLKRFRKGIVK